jgi:DNA-nicking Smr family endonuclease
MKKKDSPFAKLESLRSTLPETSKKRAEPPVRVTTTGRARELQGPNSFSEWMTSGEVPSSSDQTKYESEAGTAAPRDITFAFSSDRASAWRAGEPEHLDALIRGRFQIASTLELHGLTRDEAVAKLAQFVRESQARRERCVLVIHGRGKGSPGGQPVLKSEMALWLTEDPLRAAVFAYAPAHVRNGGEGATQVLLTSK